MSKLQYSYGWHGRHSIPDRRNKRSCSPSLWKLGRARRSCPAPGCFLLSELWKGSALRRLADQRFTQPLTFGRMGSSGRRETWMLFSPLTFELRYSSRIPYHKDVQRNWVQQASSNQRQRVIEKVEGSSENCNIDGPDDNEILDPSVEPFRIFKVIGPIVSIFPGLWEISERQVFPAKLGIACWSLRGTTIWSDLTIKKMIQ